MTVLTVADYLKYANLQMAAEAFLFDESSNTVKTGQQLLDALKAGNNHASRFTEVEATRFASEWTVVDQRANTSTGFSGTLFRNNETGELVVSFRSTEFIDDAARDNEATNKLEISDYGFAFGQLSDMETWYAELTREQGPLWGKEFSVTGYSLGGHLATAFNLMHPGAAKEVVTFNGAGIGQIGDGSLADTRAKLPLMVARFQQLRAQAAAVGLESMITTDDALIAYRTIKAAILANGGVPTTAMDSAIPRSDWENLSADAKRELDLLAGALAAAAKVAAEAARAPNLSSGPDAEGVTTNPKNVALSEITADSLDYQIAVRLVADQFGTTARSLAGGLLSTFFGKEMGEGYAQIDNQIDVVGTETDGSIAAAMVANSQWHYGQDVKQFIESQPGYRGNAPSEAAKASFQAGGFKLLVDGYNRNDFGDTHSLVLLVDSLSVQNALWQLVRPPARAYVDPTIDRILRQASAARASIVPGEQGKAEGDVLENILNALSDLILGPDPTRPALKGSLDGNTWADIDDGADGAYTGRARFHERLKAIVEDPTYTALVAAGTLNLKATVPTVSEARGDFAAYAALYSLSPFTFELFDLYDPATNRAAFDAAFSGNPNPLYQAWSADRQEIADGKSPVHISEAWLTDRARMLGAMNAGNLSNEAFRVTRESTHVRYVDLDRDQSGFDFVRGSVSSAASGGNGVRSALNHLFEVQYDAGKGVDVRFGRDISDSWLNDRVEFRMRKTWFGEKNLDPDDPQLARKSPRRRPTTNDEHKRAA